MARIGCARGWIGSAKRLTTQQIPSTPSSLGQLHVMKWSFSVGRSASGGAKHQEIIHPIGFDEVVLLDE